VGLRGYLAGEENRLLPIAAGAVLAAEQTSPVDPIVLYGPHSVGKSALLKGLVARYKQQHAGRAVLLSADQYTRALRIAGEDGSLDDLRRTHRTAGLLVIDDVQLLATRPATQQELTRTIDAMLGEGRRVLFSLTTHPRQTKLLPSLQSRLIGGLLVPVAAPQLSTRRALLSSFADLRRTAISPEAIDLLARRLPTTAPRLLEVLADLERHATGPQIDVATCRASIDAATCVDRPTLSQIARLAARQFRLRVSDLKSDSRRRTTVLARGVAMYLARQWTELSLAEIGRYFGDRDHTTVLHSCRTLAALRQSDPQVDAALDQLQSLLAPEQPSPQRACG